jgi:glycine/D-amino acid oxidase-like deaminating enzyme
MPPPWRSTWPSALPAGSPPEMAVAASETTDTCDVLIVGARCAGAATATLLARAGLDVRLRLADAELFWVSLVADDGVICPGSQKCSRIPALRKLRADARLGWKRN